MQKNRLAHTAGLGLATLALAATLTACGADNDQKDGSSATSTSTFTSTTTTADASVHNAADVAYATQMITHHQQAIEMSDLALQKSTNQQIRALATTIRNAQNPEIAQMSGWLRTWGAPVPSANAVSEHAHHGDMEGMAGMEDMMSQTQMDQLKNATGVSFDRTFLELMIKHHEGAVASSNAYKDQADNPQARAKAEEIATSQQGEIDQMKQLLQALPAS